MNKAQDHYPQCPQAMIVNFARAGDRKAFEELMRRSQSSIRNLMRRCCGDVTLADDLAQQVFLQVWLKIHALKQANAFGAWIKRLAITVWLQHLRKKNVLLDSDQEIEVASIVSQADSTSEGMDLDRALAILPSTVRLCVVLAYHEGMSHKEISDLTDLPLGTVKSHIKRGTAKLQEILSAYTHVSTEKEEM